ncbi:MAG: LytR C-terminal domain-containing protein [Gemmatimonadota bacterium]|nr:LytR C-terminal domain-containing protein [Gemmatimonadota bacterium]
MAVLLLVTVVGLVVWRLRLPSAAAPLPGNADPAITARPSRIVPDSVRIKVEVVNATATRGLGRLATAWLRDQGFDVVGTLTAPDKDRRDSSLVLDRSGHPEWAALAARAIGGARVEARVEARPDSLRYLDLTVLVGRAWRPPPQTLYP